MATKPKIERVSFQVPQSQSGVLVDKGVILAPHTGKLEGGGYIVDPAGVGVDRVLVTVDNGFGTATEVVTVKYEDPLAPVLNPSYTVKVEPAAQINWTPKGSYLTLLSGDRVRAVHWEAENLPDGVSLDPLTGRLSGRVISVGSYEVVLTCQTNCGKATSTLHLEVYPTKIELAENPYQSYNGQNYLYGFNVGDISGSSGLICIKVSPPNGAVSYPSTTKRLGRSETRYRKWSNGKWVYQMAYGSGTGISFSTCLDRIENDELYSYIYIRFTSNGTAGTGTGNVNMVASFGNLTYRYGSLSQVIPVNCLVTIYNGGTSICGNTKSCYSYSLS